MTDAATIAEVALNVPLQRTFDYRLPPGRGDVPPGTRAIVPFGPRTLTGVVVGTKPRSELPPARLRTVQRLPEEAPLFSAELLAFTRWVAGYYLCGWGEVLDAALPAGLGVRFRTEYRLRDGDAGALEGLSPAARAFLATHPSWTLAQWERAGPSEADRRWLARQSAPGGAVEAVSELYGHPHAPRRERWLRLAHGEAGDGAEAAASPAGRRAPAQQRVLERLRAEGPLPWSRLRSTVRDVAGVVRRLAADGRVEVYERAAPAGGPPVELPEPEPFHDLTPAQAEASSRVAGALEAGRYRGFLLEGVTGSGKTEVYLHAVRDALARGRSAVVLVPEIALTAEILRRFRARFGAEVAVLHSAMDPRTRFAEWHRAWQGAARVVIGARSALFAPVRDLGLIVVDEEHDGSYKQDETPRYHARDAALMRAREAGAVALLGSATPSMESLHNVEAGKLARLHLPERVENRSLPEVELLNLRREPRQKGAAFFSKALVEALGETLAHGRQAILFLNRRGFAHLVRCRACGEPVLCVNCSLSLVYHRADHRLHCHHCDHVQPVPEVCGSCRGRDLDVVGLGTERIEEEARRLFPRARILRMDSDALRRRGALEGMIASIRAREVDLIIGTQILTKGHDFPHITLVGAVLADVALNLPDFRASERTFHILTQMAGRAGRGDEPGRVLVQTYKPDHHALVHVETHDTAGFAAAELDMRRATGTPPYAHQVLLWASSTAPDRAERLARDVARRLAAARPAAVKVLGPTEAPIRKINRRYRWMVLLSCPQVGPMQRLVRRTLDDAGIHPGGAGRDRLVVDVDPYTVL